MIDILAIVCWLILSPKPNRNSLAIGKNASLSSIDIELQPAIELDYLTKEEVLQLRSEAVYGHPDPISSRCRPSEQVFGQIENGLPWWGIKSEFFFDNGSRSIEGPAEESRFIMFPYLPVAAEFLGVTI